MKREVCYPRKKLLELLPDYEIFDIPTIDEDEDERKKSIKSYIVNNSISVVKVKHYYSLWTSETVELKEGDPLILRSNNINSDDKEMLRINNNQYISPRIAVDGEYVASSKALEEWLAGRGIAPEKLEAIAENFDVYEVIEYPGVPTPSYYPPNEKLKLGASWGYSSENLKLDEREINQVLNGIEDIILREKIKCILYARVFKRHY